MQPEATIAARPVEAQQQPTETDAPPADPDVVPAEYVKQRLSVDPAMFAFLGKGNDHCPG